jgi:hypothetical protein
LVPLFPVDPAGEVDGPDVGGKQVARVFGERLYIPHVVAVGLSGSVELAPDEERFNQIRNPCSGRFRRVGSDGFKPVDLLLGELLDGLPFSKADLLPAEGDHPPADVFPEPDLVRT